MVRVVQHLLRNLRRELSQRLIREHRGDNFLVDLAIRNLERDTPGERLCRQKLGTSGAPSFVEIDQSALMQETLWAEPDFQPFHESLVKPRGAEGFQPPGTLDIYPSDLDALRTSRSLFACDTSVHGSFEQMFKGHFKRAHFDGAHGTYSFFSKAPIVARILFDPTKARLKGLGISALDPTAMTTRRETRRRREGGEGGSTVSYSAEDMVITYCLVAAVRLRNSSHEHDYVCLYDRRRNPVVPTGPAENCTSYHSDDWCVSDQDHQYMLYYVSVGINDWPGLDHQVAEHEQAEPQPPSTGADEQPASSGTQPSSSHRPVSFTIILPSRAVPPSSATMPSSSVNHPASAAGPAGQASPVVQEKSSAPPGDPASPSLAPAAEEHAKGDTTGERAADAGAGADDDAPGHGRKSHAQGRESKKTPSSSTRKKKRKKEPLPTYSSSFEEQEREKARQGD
ncbi:hypothetical protein INS49_013759 [Diaporthe citri]|uniref:uncharacterized protein n=1 Tax=Diaporthe citri TaxID=83186 RepID=UPI001C81838F|nr:uncharacterized protein INS49_013759 [Diaporthe citri]KAG6357876.1 hypothetical protein INS49_013759 [Diaporthe citri]